ncbi:Yip1 family protein [Methanoregula sp.]|uniref:Yip1 family protein n=1 Tax=Methanoregula sp. TaxID=2052170 RepID=UPI002372389B|nr:Yip1 family protein [Methanoregula sp.]MDD1686212.1 YIP1 family protein [Methanoregula sp.]
MTRSFSDILLRPGAFFADLMGQKDESLKWPLLIVLAGGIVAAGYGYLIGGLTAQMMAGAYPGIDVIILLSTIIGAALGVFIFWLVWTAVVFALSMAFKGEGSVKSTLQVVGYGYLPQVIGSVVTLIVAYEYVPKIVVPQVTSAMLQDPVAMQAVTKALLLDPAMLELTQITSLIAIVFLLWSANIWIFGIQQARKLSPRDAALCVGIPVVAYIIYMIYNLGVS